MLPVNRNDSLRTAIMRRTLSGILTALILTTAAPAAAPALPVQAAPYVKAGQASASVAVSKETVEFIKKGGRTLSVDFGYMNELQIIVKDRFSLL